MNILGYPLGLIMRLLYNILHSYGWSLILFTLLVRLVLVPLSIKQQKSSAKMAAIQPQMQEIQKMYAKNQTKMNEELQKLYQREKYNPSGGCLPMLITLLVLFGLIDVIYNPMQHILGISADVITQATEIMKGLGVAFSQYSPQTAIISSVQAVDEKQSGHAGGPGCGQHEGHAAGIAADVAVHRIPGPGRRRYVLDFLQHLHDDPDHGAQQVL